MSKDREAIKASRARIVKTYLHDNPEKRTVKNDFIEQFVLCEMECKDAMLQCWHDNGKKLDKTDTEAIKLFPNVIKNSLGPDTEYGFTEDFLLRLFGGKDNKSNPYKTKGCYSAKILRDKITHELLITAIDEVFDRREELSNLMSAFLEKFGEGFH